MAKLLLVPLIQGYSYAPKDEVVSIDLDGGAPRKRLDKLGSYGDVNCQFILDGDQYRYFMAFYRTRIKSGALPFTIDLKTEDAFLVEHEALIKKNSLKLTQHKANLFYISLGLEVKPITRDEAEDELLIELYETYGADYGDVINALEQFVNVDMPAAI